MKVYVVTEVDCGIMEVFSTLEKAKQFGLKDIELYAKINNWKKEVIKKKKEEFNTFSSTQYYDYDLNISTCEVK